MHAFMEFALSLLLHHVVNIVEKECPSYNNCRNGISLVSCVIVTNSNAHFCSVMKYWLEVPLDLVIIWYEADVVTQ